MARADAQRAESGHPGRPAGAAGAAGHLLVDREIRALLGTAVRAPGGVRALEDGVQPASLDLGLAGEAWRVRAGFLPGRTSLDQRLAELGRERVSLAGEGAVLERGGVYVAPLAAELALPAGVRARFNPRSSTGRCDIFTRVLCAGHPRFDEAPEGFAGRLWLEIAPLSFPVRLGTGDRLCQLRLARGRARLARDELCAAYEREPMCFVRERAGTAERPLDLGELRIDDEGGLLLSVSLAGRDPAGWRAAERTGVLRFAERAAHDPTDFFEPVRAPLGRVILEPGRFYVFASKERLRVPPELAAEMQPVDVGVGELRNNYAGFFDSGFGWRADGAGRPLARGTPAVLEVRAHDVPFLLEDGQVFFRLSFFRTSARPDALYGEGRDSYADQDLTLARCFHAPSTPPA